MTQAVRRGVGDDTSGGGQANAALIVGWGTPVRGQESKAPQILREALQYYQSLREKGEIEDYEPVSLEPHGGNMMSGFVLLRGKADQLSRIRSSTDFRRLTNRAKAVASNVDVIGGFIGEEFDRQVRTQQQDTSDLS